MMVGVKRARAEGVHTLLLHLVCLVLFFPLPYADKALHTTKVAHAQNGQSPDKWYQLCGVSAQNAQKDSSGSR